jgi:hypothetical protein
LQLSQQAFRQVLEIERSRARRSGRSFVVVLVRARNVLKNSGGIGRTLGERLFATLGRCLRDSDHIGWYLEGRVVGAILINPSESLPEPVARLEQRIGKALDSELRPLEKDGLRMRLCHLRPSF